MVSFFDYLYLFLYKSYEHKENGAAGMAAMILGSLQAINVLSLLMLVEIFTSILNGYVVIITFLAVLFFFQILAHLRYLYKEKVTINEMKEKWEKKTAMQKKELAAWCTTYIALSIIAFFGLAIYIGERGLLSD